MSYSLPPHRATIPFILGLGLFSNAWASTCIDWVEESTPVSSFHVAGEVLVDETTGLEWARCSLGQQYHDGQCAGEAQGFTFHDAVVAAENHALGGHDDWRLPTRAELGSIVEGACYYPAINTELFPHTPMTGFWSSSVNPENGRVWAVGFSNGFFLLAELPGYNRVRPVRAADQ